MTSEEKKAIAALKRVAKIWPESLWLFSASGSLCVMRKDSDGQRVKTSQGGIDSAEVIETIDIENDGGDW